MLALTETAQAAIRQVLSQSEAAAGLRIVAATGGCAGMQYRMGLVARAEQDDTVETFDGVAVYLDPDSAPLLDGTTVDFISDDQGEGFVFHNPNAQSMCSCSSGGCSR